MFSQEPLRFERVALAYNGLNISEEYFDIASGLRVRQVEQHGSKQVFAAKRVTDAFKQEAQILRYLASKRLADDDRNHTAIPTQYLWGSRLIITPLYHRFRHIRLNPNATLSFAKQLVEATAFLHNHRIAHMDISYRNFLVAWRPKFSKPRLLLTDMELSIRFEDSEDPLVNLWDHIEPPPEGSVAINPYAYDMWCVGWCFESFLENDRIEKQWPGVHWPEAISSLRTRLIETDPRRRPNSAEAAAIMQIIDETQSLEFAQGKVNSFDVDLRQSIISYPSLAVNTSLPEATDFNNEHIEW
ncbi:hypothetical protein FRB90_002674 [Tulasnella sp. 427]|nr:hypothetical protein FRB90_002674 [Tulasnella sp. 427]